MNHHDHVSLLRRGIPGPDGTWADLGAGRGAFTLALADLLGGGATIYAVDKNGRDLRHLQNTFNRRFPQTRLHLLPADFTQPLPLPPLAGVVMANSLHFVRQKAPVLRQIRGYLERHGRLLLVEYNTDRGNRWVPHPLSYESWARLAAQAGFTHTEKLATYPSRFLGQIYAAASWVD